MKRTFLWATIGVVAFAACLVACTERQQAVTKTTLGTVAELFHFPRELGEALGGLLVGGSTYAVGRKHGRKKERRCSTAADKPAKGAA